MGKREEKNCGIDPYSGVAPEYRYRALPGNPLVREKPTQKVPNVISESYFAAFGKPGCGAPYQRANGTFKFQDRTQFRSRPIGPVPGLLGISRTDPEPNYRKQGFIIQPDFREGRVPRTGSAGYPVIQEARKKKQTLVHRRPVTPLPRKSELNQIKKDLDHRRKTTDIRRKPSDVVIKEGRFRNELSNYMKTYQDYQRDKDVLSRQIEDEYISNIRKYKPFGRPGGGAPSISTRRTRAPVDIIGSGTTNFPQQPAPHKYEAEIFKHSRHKNRYDAKCVQKTKCRKEYLNELQDAASARHRERQLEKNVPNGISDDYFSAFGRPGCGAPCQRTNGTQKFQDRAHSDERFLNLMRMVSTTSMTARHLLQLMDFVQELGTEQTDDKSTPRMIAAISEAMKIKISELTIPSKVDLAIALMIIPTETDLNLANECLENVSETEFGSACYNMITSTNYFESLVEKNSFEEGDLAVGVLLRYLRDSDHEISAQIVRDKMLEITKQIQAEKYGQKMDSTNSGWNEIELTSCGVTGRTGPSVEQCITFYDTDWSRDQTLFSVDPDRLGIQKLTIPKTGIYELFAYGAGNVQKTGSGAIMACRIQLSKGDVILVGIGQKGATGSCGSGGTFVVQELPDGSLEPVVIAGGAGADMGEHRQNWCNGQTKEHGNTAHAGHGNFSIGSSGTGATYYTGGGGVGNGGAGFKYDPPNVSENHPQCFASGLAGASTGGGFGGGGSSDIGNGGGGGYTGGNGSSNYHSGGGGGGSFSLDKNGIAKTGWYEDGKCTIKILQ